MAKLASGLLLICSLPLYAIDPDAAREAEKEVFAARFDHAADLCSKILHDDPQWAAGYYFLVRSLIGAYRAPEAYTAAEEGLRRAPEKPETLTAAGFAAYRHGDIARAETYFRNALKLDPIYAPGLIGLAQIFAANSRFKIARTLAIAAYKLSPNDPILITAWANSLHGKEHIAALEHALAIYDAASRQARSLRAHVASDKAVGDRKLGRLTSPYQSYELKLLPIVDGPKRHLGVGLSVRFNGRHTFRFVLDTGASGISLSPKAAEQAGLEILGGESDEAHGIGDDQAGDRYRYVAPEVSIGDITFADFPVSVFRSAKSSTHDGLIGADVFQRFLVGIDFPRMRLTLEPFSQRPAEAGEPDDASATLPAGFFRALRFGNHLTIPTLVNQKEACLFLIDSGANSNIIDTAVAEGSTEVYNDARTVIRGVQGRVKELGRASRITLAFAGYRQDNFDLLTMSMEKHNDAMGVGISGILGMPVLWSMKLTIDYRNGAVRFEYKR